MSARTLGNDRAPSLRRRLLILVSVASLLMLALASEVTYHRARHEVQELMDSQMSSIAQFVMAQAMLGGEHLSSLPERIERIDGVDQRRQELRMEYQIGRPDGTVLVRSPRAPQLPITGKTGLATQEARGTPWRSILLEDSQHTLRVQLVESIPDRNEEALEIAMKTIEPLLLAFPLLLLAIYLSIRRGLKPLDELADEVATRSSDNLTPIAGGTVPREARPLVAAINRVLFRLGASLDSERRFTADAAHELRTPLAAAKIQAQVALLSDQADARRHALEQTVAGLDRATRLVEQMLRLARLDPLARLPQTQLVDLGGLCRRLAEGVRGMAPAANIVIACETEAGALPGDPELLEVALRNLIDNAVRYSPAGGEIEVFLRRENGALVLGVQDRGPGVAADELPRLTERFYRGASVTVEGNGLGLTIVGRIAELHGARLELANREGGGLVAELRWPNGERALCG